MKLIFEKDENKEVSVKLGIGTITEQFSYVKMVKALLEGDTLDKTTFSESITEDERAKINSITNEINRIINEVKEDESEDPLLG